jgi:hypothetical protein
MSKLRSMMRMKKRMMWITREMVRSLLFEILVGADEQEPVSLMKSPKPLYPRMNIAIDNSIVI